MKKDTRLNTIIVSSNIRVSKNLKVVVDPNMESGKIIIAYQQNINVKPKLIYVKRKTEENE